MNTVHGYSHHQSQPSPPDRASHPSGIDRGGARKEDVRGSTPVDQVDLSAAARQALESAAEAAGPGKSAQSAAHRARVAVTENAALANLPFGRVVSALNHGTLDSLVVPSETPDGQADDVIPITEGDENADGIAPETEGVEGTLEAAAAAGYVSSFEAAISDELMKPETELSAEHSV